MQKARIFDIQRLCVHDGPGIRTTVFFKGCPLRCAWCQNPESLSAEPELLVYADLCVGCGSCVAVCPQRPEPPDAPLPHRPAGCTACGACVTACPTGARKIAGRDRTLEEVVAGCVRDKPFYGRRGGVTLSGGEPLAQWEFVATLAGRLHTEDVHVALDTAAVAPEEVIAAVPEAVDLIIADLKMVSSEKYRRWTGADSGPILEAIRVWSRAMPGRLWLSVPLVPGVHDEEEFTLMADFVASLENAPPVRFLPYHRFGESKYIALGRPAPDVFRVREDPEPIARTLFEQRGIRLLRE